VEKVSDVFEGEGTRSQKTKKPHLAEEQSAGQESRNLESGKNVGEGRSDKNAAANVRPASMKSCPAQRRGGLLKGRKKVLTLGKAVRNAGDAMKIK